MDLPKTERGNQHVVVFQDFLTKWPMVYPVPNQKAIQIAPELGFILAVVTLATV